MSGNGMNAVDHLDPSLWAVANRLLVRKALAEFTHERLLTPVLSNGLYVLESDDGSTTYRFAAARLALDHWEVDADSIARTRGSTELPVDALDFFLELRGALGLSDEILRRARHQLALGAFTLPHELARLVLAEQLYRAGTIQRGEPYHKGRD